MARLVKAFIALHLVSPGREAAEDGDQQPYRQGKREDAQGSGRVKDEDAETH